MTFSELLEARQTLEGPATSLAAQHRSEEDMRRLESTLVDDSRELSAGDQFDTREHHAIAAAVAEGGRTASRSGSPQRADAGLSRASRAAALGRVVRSGS